MSWLFQFIGFVLQSSLWYDWLARKVGWNNLRFVTHMWRLHLDKCYLPNRTWKGERRIIRIFEQSLWKLDTNSMHLKMFIGVNVILDHYSLIHATIVEYILSIFYPKNTIWKEVKKSSSKVLICQNLWADLFSLSIVVSNHSNHSYLQAHK